jgi:hypothetical protein
MTVIDLSTLDGADGFRLDGIDAGDQSGVSVSDAGDVNGDGFADLIVGAHLASPNGDFRAGESYVVFGKASGFLLDWTLVPWMERMVFALMALILLTPLGARSALPETSMVTVSRT